MNYLLEDKKEGERLTKQATFKNYNVSEELSTFHFCKTDVVLDAGCGAGAISKYLINDTRVSKIYSCDFSDFRVESLKNEFKHNDRLNVTKQDLRRMLYPENFFDKIICRFVLQHIPDIDDVIKEFKRILKPSGQLIIIEADGFIFDLTTNNKTLKNMMEKIKKEIPVNLYMGRECPQYLHRNDFYKVDWNMTPMIFKDSELENEKILMRERFTFIQAELVRILGTDDTYQQFCEMYLDEMMIPGNVLFSNKFIISARKLNGQT